MDEEFMVKYGIALVGFAGVIVGAVFTLIGQAIERSAERDHKVRENVAKLVSSVMVYQASLDHILSDSPPQDVQTVILQKLNKSNEEIRQEWTKLSIYAPWSIRVFSLRLGDVIEQTSKYLHPATGQGKPKYGYRDLYLQRVDKYREALASLSRKHRRIRGIVFIYLLLRLWKYDRQNQPNHESQSKGK
ncbi:hypothetical protein [Glutamicibacter arilaitensis]|uniref:hypothetical protein n=1 Tax=Glutamicibacter arilaitensis TaxID=256701 RepID=UPI00385111AD